MDRISRFLGVLFFVLAVIAWALVAEARLDFLPDRTGLEAFNRQFGAGLSERPVLIRRGGFTDREDIYRLEATTSELEASRRRCFRFYKPESDWLDVLYDPASGILYARALGF